MLTKVTMMLKWRYGADTGAVDSDVWYMSTDSTNDAVRVDVVQTDELSTLQNTGCYLNVTAADLQSPAGQSNGDIVLIILLCV